MLELRAARDGRDALEAALAEARERTQAAIAKLEAERKSAATLEKARAAAVQVLNIPTLPS